MKQRGLSSEGSKRQNLKLLSSYEDGMVVSDTIEKRQRLYLGTKDILDRC